MTKLSAFAGAALVAVMLFAVLSLFEGGADRSATMAPDLHAQQ